MAPRQPSSAGPDRTVYYNMKTSRPPIVSSKSHSNAHSHSSAQPHPHSRAPNAATTPAASPRLPYSVGQAYPPKLSPSTTMPPRLQKATTPAAQIGAQDARSASPNYFGLIVEHENDPRDSANVPKHNWSPPTSSVKSFQAAIPQQMPLDANPEFEAFRRQADANRGRSSFSLGMSSFGAPSTPSGGGQPPSARPRPPRWHTFSSDAGSDVSIPKPSGPLVGKVRDPSAVRMEVDGDSNSLHDSAYVSSESKRNSEASLNPPPSFFNMAAQGSPAQFESPFESRSGISRVDDRHPRLSMVPARADPPSPDPKAHQGLAGRRGETVPLGADAGAPSMMTPGMLKELLEAPGSGSQLLLLDLRVAPQYAQSRIKGALNLCIPTTLLKRATFNLEKLQQTFPTGPDQDKFASWREAKTLVVYDAYSSERRDAVSSMNMIKKFTNEGYTGTCAILRGGFSGFAQACPSLVDSSLNGASGSPVLSSLSGVSNGGSRPAVAPVIGGVMLPTSNDKANPFFANIRQNQDLVDGVGQLDIAVPSGLDADASLPRWLRDAADAPDHGKKVSEKFLGIELAEQSRMKKAYSLFNTNMQNGAPQEPAQTVQLSGLEKGGKNRYKDILPFEHARVRLQGRPEGTCDYVNASHIKASRSHKRYIASQGPLPATFEDFWSVIWDQDVRVIVMLTAESEGGQLKCHPYWTGREYGPIKLRLLSEKKVSLDIDKHRSESNFSAQSSSASSESGGPGAPALPHQNSFGLGAAAENGRRRANTTTMLEGSTPTPVQPNLGPGGGSNVHGETPYVIIRKFALSHAAHPFAPIREITHLHYPSWPDFGAPAQPSHLLALVELANVMQRSALPVDVPGAIASAHGAAGGGEAPARARNGGSRSPKRKADPIPLTWHDEPEGAQQARPMLVHCSAGCGRTGAFCTVDSVIDMLKRQRLRNVRKANRNIERKLNDSSRQRRARGDADGDVSMDEEPQDYSDDSVSPGTSPGGAPALLRLRSEAYGFPASAPAPAPAAPAAPRADSADPDAGSPLETAWMDNDGEDLIARTVEDFRGQRLSMVQSLRQFVLCYETVIEWIWRLQERGGPGVGVGPGSGTQGVRSRGRSGTFTG